MSTAVRQRVRSKQSYSENRFTKRKGLDNKNITYENLQKNILKNEIKKHSEIAPVGVFFCHRRCSVMGSVRIIRQVFISSGNIRFSTGTAQDYPCCRMSFCLAFVQEQVFAQN
jgi:hypothetical protein